MRGASFGCRNIHGLLSFWAERRADWTYDRSKSDEPPRKIFDVGQALRLGWRPTVSLEERIALACRKFLGAP
jgi:nucleoside-diphosphate-sugar epimerase